MSKKITNKHAAEFVRRAVTVLESAGAQPVTDPTSFICYTIELRFGTVRFMIDPAPSCCYSIYARVEGGKEEIERAAKDIGGRMDFNRFSGKWNMHGERPEGMLEELRLRLICYKKEEPAPEPDEPVTVIEAVTSGGYIIPDPPSIEVYDNGGSTCDRYTVIYLNEIERVTPHGTLYACLGMNAYPFDPGGFGQHSTAMRGDHLGKRIRFVELPEDCRRAVMQDLAA